MATEATKNILTEKDYEMILGDCYVPFNSENKEEYIEAINKFINKIPNFNLAIQNRKGLSSSCWYYNLCNKHKLDILANYQFFLKEPHREYEFNSRNNGKDLAIGITQEGKKVILLRRGYYSPGQVLNSRLSIKCIRSIYSAFVLDILDPSFYSRRMQAFVQTVERLNAHDGWLAKGSQLKQFPLIKLNGLKIYPQSLQLHGSYTYVGITPNGQSLITRNEGIHATSIGDIQRKLKDLNKYTLIPNEEINVYISDFYEGLKKKIDSDHARFLNLFQQKTCK